MASRILCFLFAFVSVFINFNKGSFNKKFFEHDRAGYYLYLPAVFIYQDLERFEFYPRIANAYQLGGGSDYGLHKMENGNLLNKYPIGSSILNLPFFLIAHTYCTTTNAFEADGYTPPYRLAIIISNISWTLMGLLLVRKYLRRHFPERVTALVIAAISFGTNLYYYNAFEPGMSHTYSFFLFAAVLYFSDRWHDNKRPVHLYLLGLMIGLVTITRPTNVVIAIIPLLWQAGNLTDLISRFKLFFTKHKEVIVTLVIFFAIVFIQLSYWKYATGHWIYYSYRGEGFDFAHPKIWKGLFSYRKGWFVYTPIAFIAMLGFIFLYRKNRKLTPVLVVFYLLILYLTFSWENWYYGGSYGCRPLIETLPLLSIPLAALTEKIFSHHSKIAKSTYITVITLLISLNIFQSYQYAGNTIHWDRMSKDYYWRVFGRVHATDEDRKLLLPEQEYYDEIEAWDKN